jgi:hypothetical protein
MDLYLILRRNGWRTIEDLQTTGARSAEVGDQPGSGVRWIRSYALGEDGGDVGTACIYQADSPEAIRQHARDVGMPADEIVPILDTVIVRPDPVKTAV